MKKKIVCDLQGENVAFQSFLEVRSPRQCGMPSSRVPESVVDGRQTLNELIYFHCLISEGSMVKNKLGYL